MASSFAIPRNPIPFDPSRKPPDIFANERARSGWMGDSFDDYYRRRLEQYGPQEDLYRRRADEAMLPLLGGAGGFNPEQQADIRRTDELYGLQITPEEMQAAKWQPHEEAQYRGDPDAAMEYFNRDYLLGIPESHAANLRGTMREGSSSVRGAIDPTAYEISPEFAAEYPYSDQDVQQMQYLAGRTAGTRFQTLRDQLMRRARAAGTVNPMAVSAQQADLERDMSQAVNDASVRGRLSALEVQKNRARDLEAMRLQAAQSGSGMRLGAEQYLLGQGLGAESEAGQMMERTGRYTTDVPMDQARYAEAERSRRAGDIAGQRVAGDIYGQGERYQRGADIYGAASGNARDIAQEELADRRSARGYLTGQQQYAGGRLGEAEAGRVGAYGTTSGRQLQSGHGQIASRQPSWFNRNVRPWLTDGGGGPSYSSATGFGWG